MDEINQDMRNLNHGFGPVFRRRKNRNCTIDSILLIYFFFALIVFGLLTDSYKLDFKVIDSESKLPGIAFIGYFAALISSLITGDMLRRFTLFIEEINHVEGRHNGSLLKALLSCLRFKDNSSTVVTIVFVLSSIATLYYWFTVQPTISVCLYISIAIISSIGMRALGFNTLTEVEVSEFNEKYSANVAETLAYSYYYGYLKLVLPDLCSTIDRSSAEEHMVGKESYAEIISAKKMFIIISKNCVGYAKLFDIDPRITVTGNLATLSISRGGISNRSYKSTLYEVKLENRQPEYLILEYATPLLTIYEMASDVKVKLTMRDLEEQVTAFYLKLTEILESDNACKGKYQLILCADVMNNLPDVICKCLDDPKIDIV